MVVCNPNDLECLIGVALDLIARAKVRDMDVDEALDGLWEILVNIDYLVGMRKDMEASNAHACPAVAYLN